MAVDRSRLAAALAYKQAEEERRRQMMESVPTLEPVIAPPASRNFRRDLENLSIGLGRGVTTGLESVKGIITDPIGTAKGVYETGKAVIRNPSVIADALRYTAEKVTSGPLGAGEVIGEMLGPRKGGPVMQELDVYHGTPHRFPATEANPLGEFDASKIGTGEGAQAYGHGIYYAENPSVAQGYKTANELTNTLIDGKQVDFADPRYQAAVRISTQGYKNALDTAIKEAESNFLTAEGKARRRELAEQIKALKGRKVGSETTGSLYKADLPDEMIDRMLDWDKPLSEQPAAVREAIETRLRHSNSSRKFLEKNPTGAELYGVFQNRGDYINPIEASEAFREAGIPGIKYSDAGSRGQGGSGTRNFVVFPGEEKKVRILERDGQKASPQGQALNWPQPDKIPKGATLQMMSPQEYLKQVNAAQGIDFEFAPSPIRKPKTISKIKTALQKGETIETPWLTVHKGKIVDQEGRHRAVAAIRAGISEMPVFIYERK